MINADELLLQGQGQLWNVCFSFLKPMSLKWAIDLGVADVLHRRDGGPVKLSELAAALSVPTGRVRSLRRLMRLLVNMGVFASTAMLESTEEEPAYLLTPSSRLLVKEERLAVLPLLTLVLHPIMSQPWQSVSEWFAGDLSSPFEVFHGEKPWQMAKRSPEFNKLFNEGMSSDSRLVSEVVLRSSAGRNVFQGLRSLVDVGGGDGTFARSIVTAFPEIEYTVLDLPHVVATKKKEAAREEEDDSRNGVINYVEGDMFVQVPKAQAVLLKSILHAWQDEECIKLLKNCKESILNSKDEGGKIIIIDIVVGVSANQDSMFLETQILFDLLMMDISSGIVRTEEEWKTIFNAAGFTKYKIIPDFLGTRSIIELYP